MDERLRFHVPAYYASLEPVLVDTERDPFKHIQIAHRNTVERESEANILRVISDMQRKFRAITMVVGTRSHRRLDQLSRNKQMRTRVGSQPFFVTNDGGQFLWEVQPRNQKIHMLGVHNQDAQDHRNMQEYMFGDLSKQEAEALPQFLGSMQGGLVLGTGAGLGMENPVLAAYMREKDGIYLCHDIVPSLPQQASQHTSMRGIPYTVLPPYEEFLAPVLQAHEGPKAIVGRNLLSVCSFDAIDELAKTAHSGGVERIVLSQSAAFTPQVDFISNEYHPRQRLWVQSFEAKLDRELEAGTIAAASVGLNTRLIPHQADVTFWAHCWELLREFLHNSASRNGYDLRVFQLEHQTDIAWEDASRCLDYHPEVDRTFLEGNFNTATFSPLHEYYTQDPDLPPNTFRKKSLQWVFLLRRTDSQNVEEERIPVGSTELTPHAFLVPPQMRAFDHRFRWVEQGEHDPDGHIRSCTAQLTHEIFFEQLTSVNTPQQRMDLQRLADRLQAAYCSRQSLLQ